MDKDYSKREIDNFIKEIHETLIRIEIQTTKTNGRVTSLEQWRWMQAGGIILIGILIPIILKHL